VFSFPLQENISVMNHNDLMHVPQMSEESCDILSRYFKRVGLHHTTREKYCF